MSVNPIGDQPISGGVSYGTFGAGRNVQFFPDTDVRVSQEEFARFISGSDFLSRSC